MRNAFRTATAWIKQAAVLSVLAGLAACSGGASTEKNADTTANVSIASINYAGPAPESADVQAFKNELWVNIAVTSRCGGCHMENGQSPSFARRDDVNAAYQAALQVVNLAQPDQSRMVTKVAGGHNCWTSSPQACADILTTWIRNWASASGNSGTGTQIQLVAPVDKDVGATKTFPAAATGFQNTVYPLLTQYCSGCHTSSAATPQKPYFASSDVNEAYSEAHAKINLDTPSLSRFVVRLRDESHNCWNVGCAASAAAMLTAINNFVGGISASVIDPTLVVSKALTMYDGTVASGGNRYESHMIARYFFKEGTGSVANDTSGVDPAANLNLSGAVAWSGGWGLSVAAGGKAQATTNASKKLSDRIKASGEYTIEAWVAPANVAQEDANIVSYSGGNASRNFTLGQHGYQYEGYARSDKSDANGERVLITNAGDRDAQASLQHVVMTYDPVNGRKIYVNGVFTGDSDSLGGGGLSNWDDTFAFVLGNETSGTRQWTGLIKFVEIHDRALTLDQIQQNFAAGVGERYFVLFNVSSLTNVAQSYVMFEVSQYDSYAYLFNKPTFISLDPNAQPGSFQIKGIRIGINGAEAKVGQAYIPLDVTVSNANYKAGTGQLLSNIGTVIALEKGPDSDLFFLTFEQIGSHARAYSDTTVLSTATPADKAAVSDVGYRVFEEIDATMSKITGVPRTNTTVKTTYNLVKQQLPTVESMEGFLSAHQIGIAQLGSSYCSALVDDATLRTAFFPGFNFSTATLGNATERNMVIDPLVARTLSTGLSTQPVSANVSAELNSLMDDLCVPGGVCAPSRTPIVVKAACTAVLASGVTTIQ
ncbi:MAG: LamG domain-containing protein [Steroidobacteraceae bacterium]